jgi:hypothetical protein
MANWLGSWRVEGALRTSGVGEEDGGDGGAPVGDLDGEIPVLELVHPDHLPALRIGTAEGRGDGDAAQREEQRGSIHHRRPTRGVWQRVLQLLSGTFRYELGRRAHPAASLSRRRTRCCLAAEARPANILAA